MELHIEISNHIITNKTKIVHDWLEMIKSQTPIVVEMMSLDDIKKRSNDILQSLASGLKDSSEFNLSPFESLRINLKDFSRQLSLMNITPTETTLVIFMLKDILSPSFGEFFKSNPDKHIASLNLLSRVVDRMGILTFENFVNTRETIIKEQAQAILDMSTPVVKVWSKIILLPLVGGLDSTRAKQMMESLLSSIENNQAKVAILDISGIPVIDTLVARHLFTTIAAVKLMGAECIVTGISAKISQTIVHLGLDLSGITTCSTFADGLQLALTSTGQSIN